ncbi:early nodulin 93 [Hordeum vulgare]|nr:early nodulin 93 [Hordeum vulgare]
MHRVCSHCVAAVGLRQLAEGLGCSYAGDVAPDIFFSDGERDGCVASSTVGARRSGSSSAVHRPSVASGTLEAVVLGAKNAAIAGTVVAVPTLVSCRVLPWAKHNLNYTAQALIISAVASMAICLLMPPGPVFTNNASLHGNDYVMIRHLSFNLADSALAWRTTLPQNDFKDCKYLETLFVNNFQGEELLAKCRGRLCHHRISTGLKSKELNHKMACKSSRTTRELFDIANKYATGKEAVRNKMKYDKGKSKGQFESFKAKAALSRLGGTTVRSGVDKLRSYRGRRPPLNIVVGGQRSPESSWRNNRKVESGQIEILSWSPTAAQHCRRLNNATLDEMMDWMCHFHT